MTIKHSFQTAITGLSANKTRSALTILGIVIGVASIIMIMSIGQGAKSLILNQFSSLGSKTIFIEPGKEPTGPSAGADLFTDSLKEKDVEALRKSSNVPGITAVVPNTIQVMPTSFESELIRASIFGTTEQMAEILDMQPAFGSFFNEDDVKEKASVVVLGSEAKRKLFGSSDAIGKKIKIKERNFRVVGVIAPKGQVSLFNIDEMVIIPYTTALHYLMGVNYVHSIAVRAADEKNIPRIVEDIKTTLRESHNIDSPSRDDFHVMTQASIANSVSIVTNIITTLLTSVAAISLVVGGIGIMNIMLVSVTERTREIGLRKALGAHDRDILTQFLLEAVILTSIGGIIGILLGALLSFGTSLILTKIVGLNWTFTFPIVAAVVGITVSAFVGLVFGLYPARQASLKSPIEALRYE